MRATVWDLESVERRKVIGFDFFNGADGGAGFNCAVEKVEFSIWSPRNSSSFAVLS
jgi:hypothetical protein